MFGIGKKPANKLEQAKTIVRSKYQECKALDNDSHRSEITRLRMAMQMRNHLDKTFIDAAKETEVFEEKYGGVSLTVELKQKAPKAKEFIRFESKLNGVFFTWMPPEFSKEMFTLGTSYQKVETDEATTIIKAQTISKKVSDDLNLGFEIEVLRFLTEDEDE
ncbi:MAG TPA: hypothetical protein EYM93_03540 [Methylococcales bacterium]|nr:hypothetical protein [Methylococcales bacterium]